MSDLLQKLKSLPRIAESGLGKVVMVERDVKVVNCKNPMHISPPDLNGHSHQMKMLLTFGRMPEIVCECGTIYKKM